MKFDPENITQEELEAIERYLNGQMSGENRDAFEKRMREDDDFRKIVNQYQMLIEGVERASFKEKLDEFHTDVEKDSASLADAGHHPFLKYIAAAVLLLALGLSIWLIAFQKSAEEQLFAAYFEPDPGLITPMSSTGEYEFYTGMIDYKQENYHDAIRKWEPLMAENPESDTLNYFIGVAHLALDDEEQAIRYLQANAERADSDFQNEGYFYLGLAYLKDGNRLKAVEALRQSDDERAAQLLTELEERE